MTKDIYNRQMDEIMVQMRNTIKSRLRQGWTLKQMEEVSGVSRYTFRN